MLKCYDDDIDDGGGDDDDDDDDGDDDDQYLCGCVGWSRSLATCAKHNCFNTLAPSNAFFFFLF